MFQKLINSGQVSISGVRYWRITLEDSCFKETFVVRSGYLDSYEVVLKVISIYKTRKLNVMPNLISYYLFLNKEGYSIVGLIADDHPYTIDATDKSIQYAKNYKPILKMRLPAFFPKPLTKTSRLFDEILH